MRNRTTLGFIALAAMLAASLTLLRGDCDPSRNTAPLDPAITTTYVSAHPRGVMATSGGWAYCTLVRKLAAESRRTLICGKYFKDEFLHVGERAKSHRDWGEPGYLASLADKIDALHARIGGDLVLVGVSYSGFGVAKLASEHPEIRPDRIVVIDSYLDLVARRARVPDSRLTAKEIDTETGGTEAALRSRSVRIQGLARLIRSGTRLTVIWSVSNAERTRYHGATCNRTANAAVLSKLAVALGRPVHAWVTSSKHGATLWHFGMRVLHDRNPGRRVEFRPDGVIPDAATC